MDGEGAEKFKKLLEAPFKIEHQDITEAVFADLVDLVPVIGEIAGIYRIKEAIDAKDDMRVLLETGDLFAGFPPLIGDLLDALTPTNLLLYLMRGGERR